MKKIFIFALAAATMAVGCQKFQDILKPSIDTNEDEYAAYPVTFGTNVATVSTKAAIDGTAFPTDETIYIYGINNSDKTLLVDNYAIISPTANNTLKDVYYGANKETYSFYGYYVGEALTDGQKASYSDSEGVITVPVTITGQEDLMIGLTDKTADLAAQTKTVTEDELYSAKSARRGVTPNLVFEHKLVRFDFIFKDGSNLTGGEKSVWVEKVEVASNNTGNLKIDHINNKDTLVVSGGANTLTVGSDKPADDAGTWTPLVQFGANKTPDLQDKEAHGTIMVMPKAKDETQEYAVKLYLNQTGATKSVSQDLTLAMSGDNKFEAGKKYTVNITVYGLEAVIVDVTVTDWSDGGSFNYDPDDNDSPVFKQ